MVQGFPEVQWIDHGITVSIIHIKLVNTLTFNQKADYLATVFL